MNPFFIPSPSQGVWYLGPIPLRAYALAILLGIFLACLWASRRYKARGGDSELIVDLAIWVVPIGIIGARIYHVLSKWQDYFGPTGDPKEIPMIWHGGLAIWGGVITGTITACLVLRHRQLKIAPVADAIAPAILVGQIFGRLGNYFNQELFGRPTTLPWGLQIDLQHRPLGFEQYAIFHPTFLYEMLWNLAAIGVLLWIERRFSPRGGMMMGFYLCAYSLGRFWVENLRMDQANQFLGLRVNAWTSLLMFILGLALALWCYRQNFPRRQESNPQKDRKNFPEVPDKSVSCLSSSERETTSALESGKN